MIIVKIKCPICKKIVKGEISNHVFNTQFEPQFITGYSGYCPDCDYQIMESEWEEVKDDNT